MSTRFTGALFTLLLLPGAGFSQAMQPDAMGHMDHSQHMNHAKHMGHRMDMLAMVMNANANELPAGCAAISEDLRITVRAGTDHAKYRDGKLFGYSQHEWRAKPCARVTVRFINDDNVRHQWMLHGLPDYLYRNGMFHMELNGRGESIGSFILPPEDRTYLVHCDISQHTEKGMKAQLIVGAGSGDLPNVPGVTLARAGAGASESQLVAESASDQGGLKVQNP